MKTYITLLLLSSVLTCGAQTPDGAFKITGAQYGDTAMTKEAITKQTIIKLFKDGYWIAAFFGDPARPFYGSGGGTFKIENGRYVEKLDFYSWDSTAVGKVYTFDYKLTPTAYHQEGRINSDQYKNYIIKEDFEKITAAEPLKNAGLEGAWQLKQADWGTAKFGEGTYAGMAGIKIYAYPRFAWAYYNPTTKHFESAGGGTYQFDGTTLTEKLEYWSYGPLPQKSNPIKITMPDKEGYQQQSADVGTEHWQRLNSATSK